MNQKSQNSNSIFAFSIAALILGILSILCYCTGVGSIIAGSLGLIFVCLSHRKDQILPDMSIVAAFLSSIGILIGVAIILSCIHEIIMNPSGAKQNYEQFIAFYRNMYGIDIREYMFDWSSLPKITY